MDPGRLEQVERLTPARLGLFGLAALLALVGCTLWIRQVRAERQLQFKEQIAWDTYRREGRARDIMRARVQQHIDVPMQQERAIEQMRLNEPRAQPPPPKPRTVSLVPSTTAFAALIAAMAAALGGDAVRRTQVAEIQAISNTARVCRAEADAAERAGPPSPAPMHRATQPVMPEESGPGPAA